MTLKITKPGKLPKSHNTYQGKCRLCGCEVSADNKEDLKSGYSGTDALHGFYVDCPTEGCNRQIDMEKVVCRSGST